MALENIISKSTVAYIADARKKDLQPAGVIYLPSGTRLVKKSKAVNYRGLNRRLVLTEEGLWVYIIDSPEHYWSKKYLNDELGTEQFALIRKKYINSIKIGETVSLNVTLTRGETYIITEDLGDYVKIKVDNRKLGSLGSNVSYNIEVPRSHVKLIDLSKTITEEQIKYFKKSIIDGVAGIEKPCDTNEISAIRIGEESGFSFDIAKLFAHLKIDQSYEKTKTEEFGKDVSVTRWYYKRHDGELYRITKVQACSGNQYVSYKVVAPGNIEINISHDWAKSLSLATNNVTGQVLVSCAIEYFRLEEKLLERGFQEEDLSFIISRTANFKGIGKINECSNS
jgi:hypothetical protein